MNPGPMTILTVNAGSSSIRLDLYTVAGDALHHLGGEHAAGTGEMDTARLDALLQRCSVAAPTAIAHRVVHGDGLAPGAHRLDARLEAQIEALCDLAPLHHPPALAWIRGCHARWPQRVQYALFDTAFFHDLPAVAQRYALPADLVARHGLRRYGFHGIAHEAMCRYWSQQSRGRVISLQLGSGCSMAAIKDGRAIDTSMGFSPLEGLMMATRAGDVDPGLLLHLLREGAMSAAELEEMLNRHSGLLGVSGISGDMRELLVTDSEAARFAVDLYVYRARKYLGSFLAALGGADAVLFGGGVGEHSAPIRAAIVDGLQWAGIRLDADANRQATDGSARISSVDSSIAVHVVAVDEARVLAGAVASVLAHVPEDES